MLKHYLRQSFRNFKSNKLIFGGSIFTASLCALCISLLFAYVHNELTMDNFHKREKDIYLITTQASPESQAVLNSASLFFDFNYKKHPELENLVHIQKYEEGEIKFIVDEKIYLPEGLIADSSFFTVFDFELMAGRKDGILSDPAAMIITDKLAQKIFGSENPMGKFITIDYYIEKTFTIKGIVKTPPANSSITFDFILPTQNDGFFRSGADFILAKKGFNPVQFSEKIKDIGHSHPQFKNSITGLIPFNDIYFDGDEVSRKFIFSRTGDKKSVYILFVIMGMVFFISLLNFSNLQIININSSIKNIGINRISGAETKHVFYQKITEFIILILFSALLITAAFLWVLPMFNNFTGVKLSPRIWEIFIVNLSILFVLVSVALIYPTYVFLRIPISNNLKNQVFSDTKLAGRKVSATLQFALSFILLIASIVVVKQLDLMLNKDLGFTSSNIVRIKLLRDLHRTESEEEWEILVKKAKSNYQYVNDALANQSFIKNFSQGQSPINPFEMPWKTNHNQKDYSTQNGLSVTPHYLSLFGLSIAEGRFFEKGRDKSRGKQVIINQAAKKFWGIEDITKTRMLNKYWSSHDKGSDAGFEIIGVVKDFNSEHLSVSPQPLVMFYFEDRDADYLIEIESGSEERGIAFIRDLFEKFNPGEPVHYSLLSDEIEALYQKEKRLSEIYILFTVITFLISASGLFAIALYDTRKRTKEIGIRKVNGATISEILLLLNRDFVKWVAIAFVIATPIAWYAMHRWLQNFAYKTELSWWIFVLAGLLALGVALITVSWQSWRAATRNPVEALRYE
ncbi:ABC transporter permease [Saccharicrinis carchari]|nr:ABC transporter permease [Saccharicrinis carchari]